MSYVEQNFGPRYLSDFYSSSRLLFPLQATGNDPSEELALQAYRQGEVERAVELYTQALSETEDPGHHARLQVQIAWNLFNIGRLDEVKTHLRAALLEDPNLTLMSDYYTPDFLEIFEQARRTNFESGQGGGVPLPDLENTLVEHQRSDRRRIRPRRRAGRCQSVARGLPPRRTPDSAQSAVAHRSLDGRTRPKGLASMDPSGRRRCKVYGSSYSVTDLVLRADRLLEQGDATTALQLARQAHSLSPSNYMALEQMAEAAQKAADWKSAEYALKTALSLQPDNIDLKLRLGEVYLATFEASAARDVFKSLTEDYPHSDRTWAALGLLEARLGNFERALDALGRAIHENSLLPEVQLANGELLLLQGDVERRHEVPRVGRESSQERSPARGEARAGKARERPVSDRLSPTCEQPSRAVLTSRTSRVLSPSPSLSTSTIRRASGSSNRIDADERGDTQVIRGFLALKQEAVSGGGGDSQGRRGFTALGPRVGQSSRCQHLSAGALRGISGAAHPRP